MGVDIVHLTLQILHRHAHRACAAFSRRRHHVMTVRCGTVTREFRVDFCIPGEGVIQCLDNQYRTTAGNHEAVPIDIEGAGGFVRRVVEAPR